MAKAGRLKGHPKINYKKLLALGVVLSLLYAVLPQLGKFRQSVRLIEHASPEWLIMSVGFFVGTYLASAAMYILLAKKRLNYGRTILVEVSSAFAGSLLPVGIGSLGVNFEYLRSRGHSQAEAGAVVSTNNMIGLIGHLLLLTLTLLLTRTALNNLALPSLQRPVVYRADRGYSRGYFANLAQKEA